MRRLIVANLAVFAIGVGLGTARANGPSLLDLVGGQSITAADKTFSGWTLLQTSLPEDSLALITVEALADQPNNPGLRFTARDGILTARDGTRVTLDFQFLATAPAPMIAANSLLLAEFAIEGDAALSIFEDVYDTGGNILASMFVFADQIDSKLFDSAGFDLQQAVMLQKFIALDMLENGDVASIGVFEQRLSQVPLPAGITLLPVGLAALGLLSRRRRAAHTRHQD
jgi:hypothetical protein